jgi:hypothetical protein
MLPAGTVKKQAPWFTPSNTFRFIDKGVSISQSSDVKPEQWAKAASPMLVTEFGMVTDVKPEQDRKALSPMLVTEFGMVTDVKPEQ